MAVENITRKHRMNTDEKHKIAIHDLNRDLFTFTLAWLVVVLLAARIQWIESDIGLLRLIVKWVIVFGIGLLPIFDCERFACVRHKEDEEISEICDSIKMTTGASDWIVEREIFKIRLARRYIGHMKMVLIGIATVVFLMLK